MRVVLVIAGSDPGGASGVAVDLRTLAALGVHGTLAVTAATVQTGEGVQEVNPEPGPRLAAQIEAARAVATPHAIKIGLLPSAAAVAAVHAALTGLSVPMVLDPILEATSGARLVEPDLIGALGDLFPRIDVLTPNLPELEQLAGRTLEHTDAALEAAARELMGRGVAAVLVKGGHRTGDADDLLVDAAGTLPLPGERRVGVEARGTGCAFSSALAAFLARGRSLREAAPLAKAYVTAALDQRLELGDRPPLHLFHEFYGREGLP